MTYRKTVEIEGPHENAVESFLNTIRKTADDGKRYGVEIQIAVIDSPKSDQKATFESANES